MAEKSHTGGARGRVGLAERCLWWRGGRGTAGWLGTAKQGLRECGQGVTELGGGFESGERFWLG